MVNAAGVLFKEKRRFFGPALLTGNPESADIFPDGGAQEGKRLSGDIAGSSHLA